MHCVLNFNELRFPCCDSFYLFRTNTQNASFQHDKYLLLMLLLLQLMLKVPSISTHAGSQTSTPLIH